MGLINQEVCPLLKEVLLYKNICIGYTMFKGNTINPTTAITENLLRIKYKNFLNKIANLSLESGHGFGDFGKHNILQYNGVLSLIDIADPPIKLHKNMFNDEYYINLFNVMQEDSQEYFFLLKQFMNEYTQN